MPLDVEPVRMIRADPALWIIADDYPPFSRAWPGDEPPEIAVQLLAVVPEGTTWVDFFDSRNFEQAEYLLDPAGNRALLTWPQRERAPTYQAIFGAQRFAQHNSKGNGTTWRCSSAAQLREAVRLIDDLDVAAVRREFSVAAMCGIGVYKVRPDDEADEIFQRTLEDLRVWADHCRAVAARDLDLIITQV